MKASNKYSSKVNAVTDHGGLSNDNNNNNNNNSNK